ncbi:MAG TPA: c-type cytochrome [Saprospiraceae bacterium]|mgnify:CR=1 FL=1|nr:c-type cytochrome [Saprospiraceae bacterium]HQW56789.1 c-type cytochrome [Saprospiraceae bacterium]
MKTFKRLFVIALMTILLIVVGIVSYVKLFLPNVGSAPGLTVERTPERVKRGEYLANHVTLCIDCHSTRDWSRFSGPPLSGTLGKGGELFDQKFGFPGVYYSKNITPAGISRYSDGELFRVITTGVSKEGKALFPVMPYHYYGRMDQEDIYSIISYIRTLTPINNIVPESVSDFPMNLIINTIPSKAELTVKPPETDVVNYGKYLVNAAACLECHTKFERGKLVAGTEFGGGREFPFPDGSIVRTGNITPDEETGIGRWSENEFLDIFHTRSDSATLAKKLEPEAFNTMMPWTMYGKMRNEDLKAIYAYLQTVKPIRNAVVQFSPAEK